MLWYDVREPNGDFRISQTPATTAAFSGYLAGACRRWTPFAGSIKDGRSVTGV